MCQAIIAPGKSRNFNWNYWKHALNIWIIYWSFQVGMGKQHFTKHAYVETGPLPTCCWREVQTPTPRMSLMRPPCITLVRGVWLRLCTLWCNAEEIWRLWTKMENLQLTMQPRLGVCKNCLSLKHQGKIFLSYWE